MTDDRRYFVCIGLIIFIFIYMNIRIDLVRNEVQQLRYQKQDKP